MNKLLKTYLSLHSVESLLLEINIHTQAIESWSFTNSMNISSPIISPDLDSLQESVLKKLRELIVLTCLNQDSKSLIEWRKTVPKELKFLSKIKKSQHPDFQTLLFKSDYFNSIKEKIIPSAITNYNQLTNNSSLVVPTASIDKKLDSLSSQMQEGQTESVELLKYGFTGLAAQNIQLQNQINQLKEALNITTEELASTRKLLEEKLEEERKKQEEKEKRKKRKRLAKRDPVTKEIYDFFIAETEKTTYSNSYRGARLRLALALLLVTGIRISELLPIRMKQVKTLFDKKWIAIDRVKRGPSNHKAYLTKEGARVIQERKEDFEFLYRFKEDDSFIFTAENEEKPLAIEAWNRVINLFLKDCVRKLDDHPNIRSHSFRIGFITQLWKDTNDIEFVRQSIGHANLNTTSLYVGKISNKEREERTKRIGEEKENALN